LRIATYNVELTRKGPGLLLRDIARGKDPQIAAVASVITKVSPDILLLTGFDYDRGAAALDAFAERLAADGTPYPYRFAQRPNTGMMTAFDLDGDGKLRGPGDAQGYGRFAGEGGMAILSRLPLDVAGARDFSAFLWRDLPENLLGGAGLDAESSSHQRLSTTAHWDVSVTMPDGQSLHLMAYHATPPVFDGPEDRNGRRNHDETVFWLKYLDGALPWAPPKQSFVILGDANLDPIDGDGRTEGILALLADPRLQDLAPTSEGGQAAALSQGGPNGAQKADAAHDTADWSEDKGPGNLRVDYVLPSADLHVEGAGIWWPDPATPEGEIAATASRHRLVWVDITLP
jgi:hypothetical protein